ncbi:hypothetical protein BGX23_007932 [Mortierella sp. AD031]|nr:hypothetical protein BGX23_007932 [Mortierella sp. AD031]
MMSSKACSSVLDLQELQDLIRGLLSLEDLKACSLVSRYWNSLFNPWLRRVVSIWKARQKRVLLKRHGVHVRRLRCLYIDKSTIKAIIKSCPNIETLYLRLDANAMWIRYSHLEALFVHLQDRLTTVHIAIDGAYFVPSFLYSLCRLTNLTHLQIDPYAMAYFGPASTFPLIYTSFLECCPTLRSLAFTRGPYAGDDGGYIAWPRKAFKNWIRGIFDKRRDQLPSSPQEAFARRTGDTLDQDIAIKDGTMVEPPLSRLDAQQYNLRSLQLQPPSMDLATFLHIIRRSPSMEALSLNGQWNRFSADTWTDLSTHCLRLRKLDIEFNGTIKDFPTIATLVTLFPQLESISIVRQMFHKDPDLSTIDDALRRHRKNYGSQHPLKSLVITGTIRQQLPIAMDVLTATSVALESLKIENIIRYSRTAENTNTTTYTLSPTRVLALTAPWPCQDSLTTLDISSVVFPDSTSTFRFYSRLQDFRRLLTLRMWLLHLRDLISYVAMLKFDSLNLLDNNNDNNIDNNDDNGNNDNSQGNNDTNDINYSDDQLSLTLCFQTVRSAYVAPVFEMARSGFGPGITACEARLLIVSMPSLAHLELVLSTDAQGMVQVQQDYPAINIDP